MNVDNICVNTRREFFNRAAINWSESLTPEEASFLRFIIDKAETVPDLGKRVLDVGCGTGILFPFLEQWEVIALDISEEMLKCARQKNARHVVQYICGSVEELHFPDDSFAKAVMFSVYPHLDNPAVSLKETFRVLKPGGSLVIAHAENAEKINAIHTNIGGVIGRDLFPDFDIILSTIRQVGFEIEYSEFHDRIGIICRKSVP